MENLNDEQQKQILLSYKSTVANANSRYGNWIDDIGLCRKLRKIKGITHKFSSCCSLSLSHSSIRCGPVCCCYDHIQLYYRSYIAVRGYISQSVSFFLFVGFIFRIYYVSHEHIHMYNSHFDIVVAFID